MIVRSVDGELHLVDQHEHGRLAAGLARYHADEGFPRPEPFDSVVRATENHDIGWRDPDSKPLFDGEGNRPLHFLDIDWDHHAQFYRDGVETVVEMDPLAGLLVSMHWTGLYCRRWGTQPEFDVIPPGRREQFDRIIDAEQQRWIDLKSQYWDPSEEPRRVFEERLWRAYEWLEFWDRFSIFLCSEPPVRGPETELGPVWGPGGETTIHLERVEPRTVAVTPHPFAPAVFEVTYTGHVIPDRDYESVRDLREEMEAAGETRFRCTVVDGSKTEPG